jgi:hypothetical protein
MSGVIQYVRRVLVGHYLRGRREVRLAPDGSADTWDAQLHGQSAIVTHRREAESLVVQQTNFAPLLRVIPSARWPVQKFGADTPSVLIAKTN